MISEMIELTPYAAELLGSDSKVIESDELSGMPYVAEVIKGGRKWLVYFEGIEPSRESLMNGADEVTDTDGTVMGFWLTIGESLQLNIRQG